MDAQQLFRQIWIDDIEIEIEGLGKRTVKGHIEPIGMLIEQTEMLILDEKKAVLIKSPYPYELISFDEANSRIVVRKKASQ